MYAGRHMGVIPRPCVTYDRAEMKAPQMNRFVNGLGVQGKLRFVDDRYARHQRQLKIVQYLKSRSCADLPMTLLAGNEFYAGAQGPATVRGERPEIVRVDRRSPLFMLDAICRAEAQSCFVSRVGVLSVSRSLLRPETEDGGCRREND